MQPTIWDLVQRIAELETALGGLTSDVAWLTWAIRWLLGLQVSTGVAATGAVYFSWKNHNNKKETAD